MKGELGRAKGKRSDEGPLADHKGARGWDTWMSADVNDYPKFQRRKMLLIFIAADKINEIRVLQRRTQSNFVMVFV